MAKDYGLACEAKALEAIEEIKKRRWHYKGFSILKVARTYRHPEKRIRLLDSQKVDLLVVLKDSSAQVRTLLMQVKSTPASYHRFIHKRKYLYRIKCVLVEYEDVLEEIIAKIKKAIQEVLDHRNHNNSFFRKGRKLPIKLI